MTFGILDVAQLLDSSAVGSVAAKALEKRWSEAKEQPLHVQEQVRLELDAQRASLRAQLLDRAQPVVAVLAQKKGFQAVLEKGGIVWAAAENITAEVIRQVDALGPLKIER